MFDGGSVGHKTVLLQELVDGVFDVSDGVYVDVTGGAGGHSAVLLERLGRDGSLIILDCDGLAVDFLRARFVSDRRVKVVMASFSELKSVLQQFQIEKVSGVMADLGYSSRQLDDSGRGLSFLSDGPLDMRLSLASSETALDVLQDEGEAELTEIIREFGEERHASLLARKIKESIGRGELKTTKDLAGLAERVVGRFYRGQKIHPATRLFQALRIRVNHELDELDVLLDMVPGLLREGGRFGVISFHSLEDRRVKKRFRDYAQSNFSLVNKRVIVPGDEEIKNNPRSRSAKMRLLKKDTI